MKLMEGNWDIDRDFFMSIEDKFEIAGRGVVVTGRIETGEINVGDTVIIQNVNNSIVSTVVGVEMFRKLLDRGEAGDNVGLLLSGVKKDQIDTDSCLIKAGEESSTDIIMRCPNCGRWVMCEINIYKNKIVDKIIKNPCKIVGTALAVSTGNTAFISGGTVIDNVMKDELGNVADELNKLDFNCPKCSYSWSEES